jgi:hypothetical protein
MARYRRSKEMTFEEYEDWCSAVSRFETVQEVADEEGGPMISMVPVPAKGEEVASFDKVEVPQAIVDSEGRHLAPVPFDPVPSRKTKGWTAERQRTFIQALAETGSVHLAPRAAVISARSAYRLRVRSQPFARAWDMAQQLAVGRLSALAFDRAIHGRVEQVYSQGDLMAEKRVPSDRLLMWLLARLDPHRFGDTAPERNPQDSAAASFPALLSTLADVGNEDPS